MRSRSNSSVRLDYYYRLLHQTIIDHQDPITGLIPYSKQSDHAWVRDNTYSIISVWALSLAYQKSADVDEDRCKAYELKQTVVKLMRGLLICMMRQVDKVEEFKHAQTPLNSLHAKYNSRDHSTVVSDEAWGHLQIDATSLYLLMLAQMTASGLEIVFTLNEVSFIQNLVFYIESAYRIPDYGIWERGDKTNHGLPELNASSVGMAKAAMEAMAGLDLFGSNGGPHSIIQVQEDKIAQCNAILQSMLPRESYSKEIDSALLSVIGFPAFAVDDQELVDRTRETILTKCLGQYGCCRFLRDGYKTGVEDPHRLHYEPWELQQFENIECEWPVFLAFLSINESFDSNKDRANDYLNKLSKILIKKDGSVLNVVPEMYAVPREKVKAEWAEPGSQTREPVGQVPHKWGQSLYVISRLLCEGFLSPGELDPLNRRMAVLQRPDTVVQIILLPEDQIIQECLAQANIQCQTVKTLQQDGKVLLRQANTLSQTFSHLGESEKLRLTGRYSGVGLLATSTLYRYNDRIIIFTPEFYDQTTFYLAMDQDFVFDQIRTDLSYLKFNWQMLGRPTMILPIYHWMSDFTAELPCEFRRLLTKIQSGYLAGVRVQLGLLQDFISTSCFKSLAWLDENRNVEHIHQLLDTSNLSPYRHRLSSGSNPTSGPSWDSVAAQVHGLARRQLSMPVAEASHKLASPVLDEPDRVPVFTLDPVNDADVMLTAEQNLKFLAASGYLRLDASHSHLPSAKIGSNSSLQGFTTVRYPDLVEILKNTDDFVHQADILHYLYINKGPNWDTQIAQHPTTVQDLLQELYEKSGSLKVWWLVRYSSGMLRKRVPTLASALTDLLVRQKQVTFGLPSYREDFISQPLGPEEIASRIELCCGHDDGDNNQNRYKTYSPLSMLHQEVLIYLAMFVRTEPTLFHEMLRIRIGLIIGVMASELARCLNVTVDDANTNLMNLSPYELKNLLYHILSGKEFTINSVEESCLSHMSIQSLGEKPSRRKSLKHKISSKDLQSLSLSEGSTLESEAESVSDSGQWVRRRRIDGALNRAPLGFYPKIWKVLTQCQGLSIEGKVLSQNLIKEMTEEELKFALHVESVLNQAPEPEYRQLIVEALSTLTMFSEMNTQKQFINMIIPVNQIVATAYQLFRQDQVVHYPDMKRQDSPSILRGVGEVFYDTAPSGRYGTMCYMTRALADILSKEDNNMQFNCTLQ